MQLFIGTSGFAYKEWVGSFYPTGLPASGMLRYYGGHFDAVEINNTFFRMPSPETLRDWAEQVPQAFRFVLKAPQLITHRKRLKEVEEPVERFLDIARVLGDRMGPAFFQLPPNLKKDLARLDAFLENLPEGPGAAIEFRHASWFDEDVFEALRRRGVALCIAHGEDVDTPRVRTAGWGYLRLRQVTYQEEDLQEWASYITAQPWSHAYIFFKHEDTGTGPRLAGRLRELLGVATSG